MILPNKNLERKLLRTHKFIIGVDEVGMGCLAGPVVVCAVSFDKSFFSKPHKTLVGIRDSKLLSAKQRETLASQLLEEKALKYKICYCFPKTIDKINIFQAARRAMKRAVLSLASIKSKISISKQIRNPKKSNSKHLEIGALKLVLTKTMVLVDGPHKIPKLDLEQMPIVKGDRKVFSIACASIIAKVFRDRMMEKYAKKYPNYGFEIHKGYGTKYHMAQLASFGPTEIHRRSFAPVSKLG